MLAALAEACDGVEFTSFDLYVAVGGNCGQIVILVDLDETAQPVFKYTAVFELVHNLIVAEPFG